MSHTLHLFAHDGKALAERLLASPDEVVAEVEAWAKSQRIRGRDLKLGLKCVRDVCSGQLDKSCEDHFWALVWMGDALLERVELPEFTDVRHYSFIENYGVLPGLIERPGPYPLPGNDEPPPLAGYLPWTKMQSFAFSTPAPVEPPESDDPETAALLVRVADIIHQAGLSHDEVAYAQQQFTDVLETLIEDQLDLLAIAT